MLRNMSEFIHRWIEDIKTIKKSSRERYVSNLISYSSYNPRFILMYPDNMKLLIVFIRNVHKDWPTTLVRMHALEFFLQVNSQIKVRWKSVWRTCRPANRSYHRIYSFVNKFFVWNILYYSRLIVRTLTMGLSLSRTFVNWASIS